MKGKKGGKGASRKNETPEEKRLREEMEALQAEENRRRKEQLMREELKARQAEEEAYSRLNRNKIQNQWRKLMRIAKVESLRKDLEIMSQNHEREVDMKDAIIQMLDRDLDEAEEQYQTALRSHLQNMDAFIDLYRNKIQKLQEEFDDELDELQSDFDTERQFIVTKHGTEKKEMDDLLDMLDTNHQDNEAEQRQEFESFCEEMKNKNLEDLNVLKLTLESQIDELERHSDSAYQNYKNSTEQRTQQFKLLTMRDKQAAQQIETQFKKIQRLQENLTNWKKKIAANVRECEGRNKLLRQEKEQISKHFRAMKSKMHRMRGSHSQRLQMLSVKARECIRKLEENKKLAENILKLGELNRKLETEKEKVIPFAEAQEATADMPADMVTDANALTSYSRSLEGKPVEEWNYLDVFFRKFNRALLDKCAIDQERSRLQNENNDLRAILKAYLDGISVNTDVTEAENPLFAINGRTGVAVPAPVSGGQVIPVVEGNAVMNQTAMMQR